ncbi:MAG: MFS transporter [Chloroflexi bacterium]|nr:MFS transporter [Chloroflexota bacterium]
MNARLPLVNKLLYASDMVGSQAVAWSRNLWLLFLLAPPAASGLPTLVPALDLGFLQLDPRIFAGVILTSGRLIEAFDDPIIGWWSDRTKSRWGRRIPFVLFSTPFYGIFFLLLWHLPVGEASLVNAVYIFVVLQLFFLAVTLSGGPYEALLPEIARNHRDRMSVVGWQFYFGILGAVLGLVLSGFIKDAFDFRVMGVTIALCAVVFRYIGLAGVWRQAPRRTPVAQIGLGAAITSALSNKQFLYFLPSFVLFQTAVGMVIAWLPFFVASVLDQGNGGAVTSMLTGASLAAMAASVFGLWKLSNAKGKRWVYSACLLGTAVYLPLLYFAGFIPVVPKIAQGIAMAFVAGATMAGVNLLPKAITADITDYDELRTGMRQEGVFYATQNLFEKLGSSLAPLLLALVLLLGDTGSNPLGIRLVGPVAGAIAFFGFWTFRGYRLPSTVTRQSVREAGLEV